MNKKIIWNVLPWVALVLVLVFLVAVPSFSENKINEGRDLGKIELINEMIINNKMPIGYTYCPDIKWEELEDELYNEVESTIFANESVAIEMVAKEEEIQKQIKEALKPIRDLCEDMDLIVTMDLIPDLQAEQSKGYQQALTYVQENFNCVAI